LSKNTSFYNNLLNTDNAKYLEIGTLKGSSVCSTMYNNNANIVCIDNFSKFYYIILINLRVIIILN